MPNHFEWHYSTGLQLYRSWWRQLLHNLTLYFGYRLLLSSLFAPWKRLSQTDTGKGVSISRKWDAGSFNTVSRTIGFFVRSWLLFFGVLAYLLLALASGIGLLLWLLLPPLSKNLHRKWSHLPQNQSGLTHSDQLVNTSFGQFFFTHTGLTPPDLSPTTITVSPSPTYFIDLSKHLLETAISPALLQSKYLDQVDILTAGYWYNQKVSEQNPLFPDPYFGPSLALDLSLGYTPNLDRYSQDIVPDPQPGRSSRVVERIERSLASGNQVLLTGKPGVGKRTALIELATRNSAKKRVREVNFNDVLSQVLLDINSKKQALLSSLKEAAAAGNTILVIRDLHRFTNSAVEGYDFTDTLESFLEKKRSLQVVGLVTTTDYERYISPNLRLRKLFDVVDVKEPSYQEMLEILVHHAHAWEKSKHLTLPTPTLRWCYYYAQKYISDLPFPRKGLELLDTAINHALSQAQSTLTKEDVHQAVLDKTGVNLGKISDQDKTRLNTLEQAIHSRLVGQDMAVDLIARSLRARATGLGGDNKPIGSFLFLGPTGVGKTETAKALAEAYYGSESDMVRFDMAEYSTPEGALRLLGSPQHNLPGTLATSIKNNSNSLLLLDEIEKAPPQVFNIFLTLLDEGYISDAFGRHINCSHILVIATSNAAAEHIRELVTQGVTGETLQSQIIDYVLAKGWFSPEFINRFDATVVYHPLTVDQLHHVATLQLNQLVKRLQHQNINLTISPAVAPQLAKTGYNPAFGARPMRRIVDLVIGDLLSKAILADQIHPGDNISLQVTPTGEFNWTKT